MREKKQKIMIGKVGTMMGRNPGTGRVLKIVALSIALVSWVAGCDSVDRSSKDATPFSLDAVSGTTLIVNYWATWCGPCITEIPELNAIHRSEDVDAQVVGFNFDAPSSVAQQQADIARMGIEFPVVTNDPAAKFGYAVPQVLPTTVIISKDGSVLTTLVGPQTETDVLAALQPQ
jgi:thiol-disulfide isomerase/thioredoxin